ncbi:MAG: DUF362 domain-containing protein [Armatimonadota bacterium]
MHGNAANEKPVAGSGPMESARPAAPRGRVAVVKAKPETVLDDIARAMSLAGARELLPADCKTILKINISWQHYYPACSTTPWQLDGVVKTLLDWGHRRENLIPAQNRTVVVDPKRGADANKHTPVLEKYGIRPVWLYEPDVEWFYYEPKGEMLALTEIFPEGIYIPRLFVGASAIHLPTLKTHVFTTTTGAMKNAFGGLLDDRRHWCHARIHESLVDLLQIQQEIHPALFAVMDGTICGSGPGPRAMEPVQKDYLLASADQVAIDAIAAKMMGFDPMGLDFIRLAHEKGLGVGDPDEIEVVGEDISGVNFRFRVGDTFASRGQKAIYHGWLKFAEHFLLRSPIVPWSYFASNVYHNWYWYPFKGRKRVRAAMKTPWGKLFQRY